jgi:hypothetical protein
MGWAWTAGREVLADPWRGSPETQDKLLRLAGSDRRLGPIQVRADQEDPAAESSGQDAMK